MDKTDNIRDSIITIGSNKYRLARIVDKTAEDIHHIISRKLINKFDTNNPINKVRIKRREHIALNQFFLDKQNPRDQFKKIFELVKPVLSEWVRHELYTILYMTDDKMFYNEEIVKDGSKKKKRKNKGSWT